MSFEVCLIGDKEYNLQKEINVADNKYRKTFGFCLTTCNETFPDNLSGNIIYRTESPDEVKRI